MTKPWTQTEIAQFRGHIERLLPSEPIHFSKRDGERVLATFESMAKGIAPAKEPSAQENFTLILEHMAGYLEQIQVLQVENAELRLNLSMPERVTPPVPEPKMDYVPLPAPKNANGL